ncbi:DedA family protein [Streptomyces sp. NBC_01622]|uniref:DedA family protein n=1 Tax=Streptomyces sp. NBC_01622 TaxID=2975903 RepID=UPI0038695171|nr:DedA family protein [Streptomyces sp. NBC_01622]
MGFSVATLYDHLAGQPVALLALLLCAVMVGETLIFVGLMLPGDSLTVLSGTVSTDPGRYLSFVAAATIGSVIGEVVGYGVGHRLGRRLSQSLCGRMSQPRHWQRAREFVSEGQRWHTLVWLRFVPVAHTLAPLAAGASNRSFRWFLRWSAISSLLWSALYVGLGAVARASSERAAPWIPLVTLLVPLVGISGVAVHRIVRRRREQHDVRGVTTVPRPTGAVRTQMAQASGDRHCL